MHICQHVKCQERLLRAVLKQRVSIFQFSAQSCCSIFICICRLSLNSLKGCFECIDIFLAVFLSSGNADHLLHLIQLKRKGLGAVQITAFGLCQRFFNNPHFIQQASIGPVSEVAVRAKHKLSVVNARPCLAGHINGPDFTAVHIDCHIAVPIE